MPSRSLPDFNNSSAVSRFAISTPQFGRIVKGILDKPSFDVHKYEFLYPFCPCHTTETSLILAAMLMTVESFRHRVENDCKGLIADLQALTGRYGTEEADAWESSLGKLSHIF